MKQLPSGLRWGRGRGGHTSPHGMGQILFVAVACCKGLWGTWHVAGRPSAQLGFLLLGSGMRGKAGGTSGLWHAGPASIGHLDSHLRVRATESRAAWEGEWGTACPQETGPTSLFSLPGLRAGSGVRAPVSGVKTGHGVSRNYWKPGRLSFCCPRLGVDQAEGPWRCPLSEVRPSSRGHCPTRDANSACPVATALPSALAPDPLAGRTLDIFCFERKQTLLKLLLGVQPESLVPSLGTSGHPSFGETWQGGLT